MKGEAPPVPVRVVVRRLGRPDALAPELAAPGEIGNGRGGTSSEDLTGRVTVVPPDATRPILARCPACARPILCGEMTGWVTVQCRHCRLILRVELA